MKKDRPYPIWLGSWETKERRVEALEVLARQYAGTTHQGAKKADDDAQAKPNISKLIQMIADGELKLRKK